MPQDTDLHKAARDGSADEITELLDNGMDVNAKGAQGRTALHRCLGSGFSECAALLIERGADPNVADQLKRTSLHWAAMAPPPGNYDCCKIVFEKGDGPAMMKKVTKSGSTPLHSAAGTNRVEAVRFLVENGADLTAKDDDELTPFDLAKQQGFADVMALLNPKGGGGGGGVGGGGEEKGGGCCLVQ